MKTLSPTKARAISLLFSRGLPGAKTSESSRGKIIALRPVTVHSDDYALQEYGVTERELDRFVKRMNRRIAQERKKGTITKYSGNLEADLAD